MAGGETEYWGALHEGIRRVRGQSSRDVTVGVKEKKKNFERLEE